MAAKVELDDAKRNAIVKLMFQRVKSPDRIRKIINLSRSLSEGDEFKDTFYASVYHYSLEENWQELERDFAEFADTGLELADLAEGEPELEKPKRSRRGAVAKLRKEKS